MVENPGKAKLTTDILTNRANQGKLARVFGDQIKPRAWTIPPDCDSFSNVMRPGQCHAPCMFP
jgi:hypothetical protein